jgi:hypothetical protein
MYVEYQTKLVCYGPAYLVVITRSDRQKINVGSEARCRTSGCRILVRNDPVRRDV